METCPIPHTQGLAFKDHSRLSRRRVRFRTCLPDWFRRGPDREITALRHQMPELDISPVCFARKNPISPAIGSSTATMWIHAVFRSRSTLCHRTIWDLQQTALADCSPFNMARQLSPKWKLQYGPLIWQLNSRQIGNCRFSTRIISSAVTTDTTSRPHPW